MWPSSLKLNMRHTRHCMALVFCCLLVFSGCSKGGARNTTAPDLTDEQAVAYAAAQLQSVRMPTEGGDPFLQAEGITVETGQSMYGYMTVTCSGLANKRHKLQVQKGEQIYYYDLYESDRALVYPFQMGDGEYSIALFQQVTDDKYAKIAGDTLTVTLESEFDPFLYPNEYIYYTRDFDAVTAGLTLAYNASGDVEIADRIFRYVSGKITYDNDKARLVEAGQLTGYLPDPDSTLADKTGICLDYASLLACMLRANGIPAKLIIGYAEPGHVYHAWNMIYLTGSGWVGVDIRSDGSVWLLADATFAASESTDGVTYFPIHEY